MNNKTETQNTIKQIFGEYADKNALIAFLTGFALTAVILSNRFLTFYLTPLKTLVHEIGHTLFGWLFGYPSIPAFNFFYGGGLTMYWHQNKQILIFIYLTLIALMFFYRRKNKLVILTAAFLVLHMVFALTNLHETLILFMGHGFELIFALIFGYRGLTGVGSRNKIERALYCMMFFYIVIMDINFSYSLLSDVNALELYLNPPVGLPVNDFVQIAEKYQSISLIKTIWFFYFCSLLTPVTLFAVCRLFPSKRNLIAFIHKNINGR